MLEHPESLRYSPTSIGSENADGLGNQQSNEKTVLAFLGGLVTGEGCFTIGVNRMIKQSQGKFLRLNPIFSMSMNDERTMRVFTNELDARGIPTYLKEVLPNMAKNGLAPRVHWNLQVVGLTRVPMYTELLLPYLYGQKKDAATVVDRFCRRRINRHKRGIDEDDLRDIEEIRAINAKNGGNKYSISDLRDYTERRTGDLLPARKI